MVATVLIAVAAAAVAVWRIQLAPNLPPEVENALRLRNLRPNQWVKYHEERPGGWTRQGHAGIAFDTRRATLLIFGSDTHGENWDDSVHEFHPLAKRWETHQQEAARQTYRVDATGAPVAGADALMPWAMHTYDAIAYHPGLDALVVMSTTEHTPTPASLPRIQRQPTWIYDLGTRQWRIFDNGGKPAPTFFGAAAAFDERRGVLVAYGNAGVWEMDAAAGVWRKASSQTHHGMHHTMVYDPRRGGFFVFGDYQPTNLVWSYLPGSAAGDEGWWSLREPRDNGCPTLSTAPVAYDAAQDVFVLVANEPAPGTDARARAESASTWFYHPGSGKCSKLAQADLPAVGMNYMMAWDPSVDVMFLVTGDWHGTVTVWALKPKP